jgi:large repetitive protein
MNFGRCMKRWKVAAAITLAVATGSLASSAAPAAALVPTCSAVLFVPVDGTGAYMVEQPDRSPGAIFCEPSLGSLEFDVGDPPAHGEIDGLKPNGLGGASFGYTPAPGFAGEDSFSLAAHVGEDEASVRVEVSVRAAADDAPICSAQLVAASNGDGYLVDSGAPVTGTIDCFDDEGDALTFSAEAPPAHGELGEIHSEGDAGASFTYTPSPGYAGSDQFALVANDGTQDSEPVVVDVTVAAATDDPPSCAATLATTSDASANFEIEQGETVHGALTCVDEEPDALDFDLAAPPAHGALAPLSADGGGVDIAYTPSPGYLGFDSFRVDVSDGFNPAVPVTVRIRVVAPHDDPPTCTAQLLAPVVDGAFRIDQGETVDGELRCEDDEGAPLDYGVSAAPQHGALTQIADDGHFSYTAPASYLGPEKIALVASDGSQDSQPAVLEIAVAAPEKGPACEVALGVGTNTEDEYLVERDGEAQGRIACSEGESGLELAVAAIPAHGSIGRFEQDTPASATFSYVPTAGYVGSDGFTLAASDGETTPRPMPVVVQVVEPSPHAPHCQARLQTPSAGAGYEVESGESVAGTLTCFDADGDDLGFSVEDAPDHGSIVGLEAAAAGMARFTYTADSAWTGPDGFALLADDGTQSSNVVDLDVDLVPPVDDPPVCSVGLFSERQLSGAYPAEESEANPGFLVCDDDEGETLSFSIAEDPEHGAITGLPGEGGAGFFDYEADAGYLGPDLATLNARDPAGGEDSVVLELEVGPAANTAPSCTATLNAPFAAGSYEVGAGTSASGSITCIDAELDPLAFSVVQSPSRGTLSALGGTGDSRSFTYTAASGGSGSDEFSLKANDGRADSAIVQVILRVKPAGGTEIRSSAPASSSAPPPAPSPPKKKPGKCRKGFKKKKVRGKVKCVKKPKKHKAGKRRG